jgi:signal transduction histidine kinase
MPRQAIKRTVEGAGRSDPEGSLQVWAEHRQGQRLDRFDAWISDFSRQAFSPATFESDRVMSDALGGLGRGMQADRVVFYSPSEISGSGRGNPDRQRFAPISSWSPTFEDLGASTNEPLLTIDTQGELGRSLFAGRSHCTVGPLGLGGSLWERVPTTSWAVRATLYVPCFSSAGCLGIFVIEAERGASRWNRSVVDRAEFVARLFTAVLDRVRLEGELDGLRGRQADKEGLCALGNMASGVAHDFNNVLTAILGYADLLEMELPEESDAAGRIELNEIRSAATRATDLVDQVLSFGRIRERGVQSIDPSETLSGLEGMLRRIVGNRVTVNIDVNSRKGPDGPSAAMRVAFDPGRFERVLLNLAANARDALEENTEDPRFELSTHRVRIDAQGFDSSRDEANLTPIPDLAPREYMRLTARDNGCGIESGSLERVFDRFYTTKAGTGTGLGLAITTEFVRAGGGGIGVESALGEGSSFHLYFPLISACDTVQSERRSHSRATNAPRSDSMGLRV